MRMISAYCAERSRAARLRLLSAIRHLPHDTSGPAPGCWSTRVAGSLGRAEPLDLQLVHRVLVGDRLVDGVEELGVAVLLHREAIFLTGLELGADLDPGRSEGRRVGKGGVRPVSSR